jgi:hypothetical protein
MTKPQIGETVYLKKSAPGFRDTSSHTIKNIERKSTGVFVAVLENDRRVVFRQLTDIPCEQMECGKCKWHNSKEKGEKE